MSNWNNNRWKRPEHQSEPATMPGPKPGDFAVGSLQSRAAARSQVKNRREAKIRFIPHIPRTQWYPVREKSQYDYMEAIFTDDPEEIQ
jgi:hypothetical protein